MAIDDRILPSIKKLLGLADDYDYFDDDVIVHINSAFSTLHQLGVGPDKGFMITDDTETWNNFIPEIKTDKIQFNNVKTYIYLKVKLVFDPPSSSAAMDSIRNMISEYEWRLQVEADESKPSLGEEENQNGVR